MLQGNKLLSVPTSRFQHLDLFQIYFTTKMPNNLDM